MNFRSIGLLLAVGCLGIAAEPIHTVFDYSLVTLDGKSLPLKPYAGKVLLIVNLASQSEFHDQIAKLETLYEKYQAQGLVVVGVPCNDFGAEEPEPAEEISKAYADYHLKFPLTGKSSVIGKEQLPLFKFLAAPKKSPKKEDGGEADDDGEGEGDKKPPTEVPWNFSKYLISRKGQQIARFDADVPPDSPVLMAAIEDALNAKPDIAEKTMQRASNDENSRRWRTKFPLLPDFVDLALGGL